MANLRSKKLCSISAGKGGAIIKKKVYLLLSIKTLQIPSLNTLFLLKFKNQIISIFGIGFLYRTVVWGLDVNTRWGSPFIITRARIASA